MNGTVSVIPVSILEATRGSTSTRKTEDLVQETTIGSCSLVDRRSHRVANGLKVREACCSGAVSAGRDQQIQSFKQAS